MAINFDHIKATDTKQVLIYSFNTTLTKIIIKTQLLTVFKLKSNQSDFLRVPFAVVVMFIITKSDLSL